MTPIVVATLALVGVAGTVTALTADPARQAVTLSVYGVLLAVLFLVLAAPDVALSEMGANAAIVPLIIMLTVRKVRGRRG